MKTCRIDGCDREVKTRGLCNKHYLNALRKGLHEQFDGPGTGKYAPETSRTCPGVATCGKKVEARGLCGSCYQMRKKIGAIQLLPRVNVGTCKAEGCDAKAKTAGFCIAHYEKFRKYGDPFGKAVRNRDKQCSVDDCVSQPVGRGLCPKHYAAWKAHGDPTGQSAWAKKRYEKIVDDNGYVMVYAKGHGNARKSGRVPEHRLVMSEHLGRPLHKNENVHHKNGDRADNSLTNLELWVTVQPPGQRPLDLMNFARFILKTYASDEKKLKALEYRNQ